MFCPFCEKEIESTTRTASRVVDVYDDKIAVADKFYTCPECEAEWSIQGFDFAQEVFNEYRRKHGWMTPEQIKVLRARLSLTQYELGWRLNCNAETVDRYERGGLQTEAHEKILRDMWETRT